MTATFDYEVAELDVWDVYDKLKYDPHPAQQKVLESDARHRVVSAGRRFGKSDLGGHDLVPEALATYSMRDQLKEQGKRREFWIVGPEYSDSEKEFRVAYNNLSKLDVPFDKPGTYNDPISGNMHISLWGGTFQLHGKSAKYPNTLVGEGLCGVVLSEAAKLKHRIWTKFVRPMLADFNGWSLHSSTPEGRNWFYDNYARGQDPRNIDWASWKVPAWANSFVYKTPTLSGDVRKLQKMMRINYRRTLEEIVERYALQIDSEILSLMDDMTEETFNQEIGADFTDFAGRVFKDFDEEVHVGDFEFQRNWQTYAAVDYGFTNPNVWCLIQVGPWGDVRVISEYYKSGETAVEFAEGVQRAGLAPSNVIAIYPDPASPGDSKILSEKLRIPIRTGTGGPLSDRLDGIREGLKLRPKHLPDDHPDKKPQLMFDRSCKNCIREFQVYRYPDLKEESSTPGQELPMKKDDHTPEAVGRFWAGFFLTPQQNARGSRNHKAKVRG